MSNDSDGHANTGSASAPVSKNGYANPTPSAASNGVSSLSANASDSASASAPVMANAPQPLADSATWKRFLAPALAMAAIVLLSNELVQFPINEWLTWGAFSYPVTYFVTDVCNRWAGPKLARRVAWAGFVTGAAASVLVALRLDPEHVAFALRIAGASGAAFIVSQLLDVAVFNRLRRQSWWKAPLWGSAIASVVDTSIFFSLAFAGTGFAWFKLASGDLAVKLAMAIALLYPFRLIVRGLAK